MKISTGKFIDKLKLFLRDEIVSQLSKNTRFWLGMALKAADEKTLPLLAEVFPGVGSIVPMIKASGIVSGGEVDIDKLEEILSAGFEMSDNELLLSMTLPQFVDPEQKRIEIKLTPHVWNIFKQGLR